MPAETSNVESLLYMLLPCCNHEEQYRCQSITGWWWYCWNVATTLEIPKYNRAFKWGWHAWNINEDVISLFWYLMACRRLIYWRRLGDIIYSILMNNHYWCPVFAICSGLPRHSSDTIFSLVLSQEFRTRLKAYYWRRRHVFSVKLVVTRVFSTMFLGPAGSGTRICTDFSRGSLAWAVKRPQR